MRDDDRVHAAGDRARRANGRRLRGHRRLIGGDELDRAKERRRHGHRPPTIADLQAGGLAGA